MLNKWEALNAKWDFHPVSEVSVSLWPCFPTLKLNVNFIVLWLLSFTNHLGPALA